MVQADWFYIFVDFPFKPRYNDLLVITDLTSLKHLNSLNNIVPMLFHSFEQRCFDKAFHLQFFPQVVQQTVQWAESRLAMMLVGFRRQLAFIYKFSERWVCKMSMKWFVPAAECMDYRLNMNAVADFLVKNLQEIKKIYVQIAITFMSVVM